MIEIRREQPEDEAAIRMVNEKAFGQPTEAGLVDALRRQCPDILSLVAESGGQVVGHILFSPVVVATDGGECRGMGLGPMAVLPEYQRQGIGTELVRAGMTSLRGSGCPFVVVLGHPEYYPRFGFTSAAQHRLLCQWEGVPTEVFMARILDEQAMVGVSGIARYRAEFDQVG